MAPFFMAHLRKLPTYFVKGDERRAAYYTIQAKELRAAGFVEEGEKAEVRKPIEKQPEIVVEAGASAFDSTDSLTEPVAEEHLKPFRAHSSHYLHFLLHISKLSPTALLLPGPCLCSPPHSYELANDFVGLILQQLP